MPRLKHHTDPTYALTERFVDPSNLHLADAARRAGKAGSDEAVHAEINESRWIVQCPDCPSAQFAAAGDHRFMCYECFNAAIGGLWRPVVWPRNADAIESVLLVRPAINRNWTREESVADLRRENLDNDLPPEIAEAG